MLVLGGGWPRNLPAWLAAVVGWAGLLLIGVAAVAFDATTPFPGVAALVPVVGTRSYRRGRGPASWPQPQPLLVARPDAVLRLARGSSEPGDTWAAVRGRPAVLFDDAWLAGERARAEAAEATFVDTASWLCPTEPCPLVLGRYLVYRDTNHLALPLSWALTPRLTRLSTPD